MGCNGPCKIFLIILNAAFLLGGLALVALGIIALVREEWLYKITSIILNSLAAVIENVDKISQIDIAGIIKTNAIILLVVGVVLLGFGILGACGAKKMHQTMLKIYALVVVAMLMVEIGFGVYAYMYSDKFEEKLQNGLKLALYKTYEYGLREEEVPGLLNSSQVIQEYGMDSLQLQLQCCGITNKTEWELGATEWNTSYSISTFSSDPLDAYYPPSCCMLSNTSSKEAGFMRIPITHFNNLENCMGLRSSDFVQQTPCYDRLKSIIKDNQQIIIITLVIIVIIEIMAVFAACYLMSAANEDSKVGPV